MRERNEKLTRARENRGLSQRQIAEKARISKISYQRYEQGERVPNVNTAIAIAKTLNSTVEELFGT